jgi:hypothetical protein
VYVFEFLIISNSRHVTRPLLSRSDLYFFSGLREPILVHQHHRSTSAQEHYPSGLSSLLIHLKPIFVIFFLVIFRTAPSPCSDSPVKGQPSRARCASHRHLRRPPSSSLHHARKSPQSKRQYGSLHQGYFRPYKFFDRLRKLSTLKSLNRHILRNNLACSKNLPTLVWLLPKLSTRL